MPFRRALVPTLVAVLMLGSPVLAADEPLTTDPEGDAGRCTGFCITPTVASDPAIDIVEADIDLAGRTLEFAIGVLDLDRISTGPPAPKGDDGVHYTFWFQRGDVTINVSAYRTYAHADPTAGINVHYYDGVDHNITRKVPFAFDAASSTVRVSVPLSTLNAAIEEACAACEPVGRGTVFTWIDVAAYIFVTVHTGDDAGSGYLTYSNVDGAGGFGTDYTVGS